MSPDEAAKLRVLCLHGNSINDLAGLGHMRQLLDLNVSSNHIADTRPLQHLTTLTALNLASNRLQSLQGLASLTQLERLVLSHNFIASLNSLQPDSGREHSLTSLDLRNNALNSLQDLAVLKAFTNLRDLKLKGGNPGNAVCNTPSYRHSISQLLPQLAMLDEQSLDPDRQQVPSQQPLSGMLPNLTALQPMGFPFPLAVLPQCLPAHLQSASHNAGSGVSQPVSPSEQALVNMPDAVDIAQENRIAAIEHRLHNMLRMRHRPALVPADNLLPRSAFQATPQIRKNKAGPVMHEIACQTATSMLQLDRLQHDAAHLRDELETLAGELESRTSSMALVEEQAEALLHEAEEQAASKVLNLFLTQASMSCISNNHNKLKISFQHHAALLSSNIFCARSHWAYTLCTVPFLSGYCLCSLASTA